MTSGPVNSSLTRGYGTLGGLAIIGAALFAVPSTLLLEPLPPGEAYLSTLAALTTGLVCLALPWERLDPRWLHLFGALATVEAAWAVAVFGQAYMAFFFLVAVSVAYVTPDARTFAPHLALIGLAMFGPVLYGPEEPRSALQVALVVYPLLVFTAALFAYLRQRMVADHRSYRLFAEETLALADRIAGHSITAPKRGLAGEAADLPQWSRFHVSARAAALAAGIFAIPLLSAGLAVAGVKLPAFALDTFDDVGIDLPNQGAASTPAVAAPSTENAESALDPERSEPTGSNSGDRSSDEAEGGGGANESSDRADAGGSGGAVTSTEITGGSGGGSEPPASSASSPSDDGSPSAPSDGEGGSPEASHGGSSLGQALEDTLSGLSGLLRGEQREGAEESPE